MSDEKDSKFKVTDRRKFNADGTAREPDVVDAAPSADTATAPSTSPATAAEAAAGQTGSHQSAQPSPSSQSRPDNVVSFPGQQPIASQASAQASGTAAQATAHQTSQTSQQREAERAYAQTSASQKSQMPPATFLAIVNMLGIEAAMQLGMVQMPGQEEVHLDLEAARHMIDLLGVLRQKTRGNLTAEEDQVMENLLADLRMQFVSLSGRR